MIADIQLIMAVSLFVLGLCSCIAGLWTILSKKYREALSNVSAHSAQLSSKAIGDAAVAPLVDAISGLIRALDQLVRTSVGIGVFLCLVGAALCTVGFWMLERL
jgi:hypothetical protein